MAKRAYSLVTLMILLATVTQPLVDAQISSAKVSSAQETKPSLEDLINAVSTTAVLEHVKYFSNLGSRVPGYNGFYEAANYIKKYWTDLGFKIMEEEFEVTVPIVEMAKVKVEIPGLGLVEINAYPLWPNHVNPCPYLSPPSGDRLVYAGSGNLEDFDNVSVENSFVLMEFNNRWYWKYAAMFKAKGVIFIWPDDTTVVEALQKVFSIPVNFPRLLVDREAGLRLKELLGSYGSLKVWVEVRAEWKSVKASNIIAVIDGADSTLRDEVAIIGAYYDSWSITPQLAPGATDAIGISYLLELSKLFKQYPPKRTVWLVAFAGHYQALAGAREFVDRHFGELGSKLKMMITLDLASDSDILAAYAAGAMYGYNRPRDILPQYDRWMTNIVNWVREIENATGEPARLIDGVRWTWPPWAVSSPPFEPFLRYFEAEVFTKACYGGGLGFVTTNALRKYQWTFLDTSDRLKLINLERQFKVLTPLLYRSVNIVPIPYSLYPRRIGAVDHGLVSVVLQLGKYNATINMFSNYTNKDAVFFVSVSPIMSGAAGIIAVGFQPAATVGSLQSITVPGVTVGLFAAASPVSGTTVTAASINTPTGFTLVLKPNEKGMAVLKSVMPLTAIDAQAYVVDSSGRILSATDTGPFGTGVFTLGGLFGAAGAIAAPLLTPMLGGLGYLMQAGAWARAFTVQVPLGHRYVPVFNCSSIALIGFYDPLLLSGPQSLSVQPLNFVSHSYLVWRDVLTSWPEAMVFVEPGTPVEVLIQSQGRVIAVLNNASESKPYGQGYMLSWGDTLTLSVIDAVLNTYFLVKNRGTFLENKMTTSPRMLAYLDKLRTYMDLAFNEQSKGSKSRFVKLCLASWQYMVGSYDSEISLLFDVSQTAVFFFFLSVAFALLASRLIGRTISGKRQTLAALALILTANAALALVHPGYSVANNVWMLISGISVALLLFLVMLAVIDVFNTTISELSISILGFHRADVRRSTVLPAALSMGIENLKKRAVRTALTLVTITATVVALVLFTTVGVALVYYGRGLRVTAPYTGVLVRRPFQQLYMPIYEIYTQVLPELLSSDSIKFQALPRAWIYPPGQSMLLAWSQNGSGIRCILAMTPEESRILERALNGTYFTATTTHAVMMTESLAKRLSALLGYPVELGSEINLLGINVTVVGLLDKASATALLSSDLDGNPIIPPDPISTGLAGTYSPLDLDSVIIVPYSFALRYLNSLPNVIRMSANYRVSEDYLRAKAQDLAIALPFDVFYGVEKGAANVVARRDIYTMGGLENIAVPLVLSALTILTVMLGAVYERRREIFTLTTVGAAPSHIDTIFLVEGFTLAFIGAYIGYIAGSGLIYVLRGLNALPPGLIPNVSSAVVIVVIGVIVLTVVLSTLYPAVRATQLATPSLLRAWRIETKPRVDRWEITMPFTATRDEAVGILAYLKEYMEAYSSERERARVFMLASPPRLEREGESYKLSARLHMAPFDAGIIQDVEIRAFRAEANRFTFNVILRRVQGPESIWVTTSRNLVGELRKQFLAWRALPPGEKEKYLKIANEELTK